VLEHSLPHPYATTLLGRLIQEGHGDFRVLERTGGPGQLTVLHMVGAPDLADYERRALEWAAGVWGSWRAHQELIRAELGAVLNAAGS
jgi:hypothetical protein